MKRLFSLLIVLFVLVGSVFAESFDRPESVVINGITYVYDDVLKEGFEDGFCGAEYNKKYHCGAYKLDINKAEKYENIMQVCSWYMWGYIGGQKATIDVLEGKGF